MTGSQVYISGKHRVIVFTLDKGHTALYRGAMDGHGVKALCIFDKDKPEKILKHLIRYIACTQLERRGS